MMNVTKRHEAYLDNCKIFPGYFNKSYLETSHFNTLFDHHPSKA